jgi:hypothetical protein
MYRRRTGASDGAILRLRWSRRARAAPPGMPYCGAPASWSLSCFVGRWFEDPARAGVLTFLSAFAMWQLLIS